MSQKNKQAKNTEILIIISSISTSPQQEKKKKKKKTPFNVFLLSDFETINTSESLRPSTDIFVYGM